MRSAERYARIFLCLFGGLLCFMGCQSYLPKGSSRTDAEKMPSTVDENLKSSHAGTSPFSSSEKTSESLEASRPSCDPSLTSEFPSSVPEPEMPTVSPDWDLPEECFVRIKEYIPTLFVDLKYATEDNFTNQVIYDFTEPVLRLGTVKKLAKVQETLLKKGYSLKIWDAYRPTEAQFRLWEVCPDPDYVSDPNKGFSNHSRGNTVDVTLVRADGSELEMPTGFDDFSALADRDYSDISGNALVNVQLLENTLKEEGFRCYWKEWWHYTDEISYPVEK